MDDVRLVIRLLKNGEKFDGVRITHRKEWEVPDFTKEMAIQETRQEVGKVLSSAFGMLNFTTELASDFQDDTLPTLDFRLWTLENNTIMFSFYEKPMNNPYTMMKDAAAG